MVTPLHYRLAFATLLPLLAQTHTIAQTVLLPTARVFSVRTAVKVPDGGSISLAGGNVIRSTQSSLGSKSSLPLFRNRFAARSASPSRAVASAKIIQLKQLEQQWLAESRRSRTAKAGQANINPAIKAKADFISRHVGKRRRR